MSDEQPAVHRITLELCELCINGAGGECHVPGCALYLSRAPDLPLAPEQYEDHGIVLGTHDHGGIVSQLRHRRRLLRQRETELTARPKGRKP